MKDKKKYLVLMIVSVMAFILITVGVTYSFFAYIKVGTTDNTIKAGNLTFHYEEKSQGITLQDAMPMTDIQGKAQSKYFDFKITSSTSESVTIPYYITARMIENSNGMENIVKIYLTDQSDQEIEAPIIYSDLDQYRNDNIDLSKYTEKLIHQDKVPADEDNYEQTYRLRMWIDNDTEYLVQENGVNTYPYEGKTFTLKINVYSNGKAQSAMQGSPISKLTAKMTAYTQDGENIYRYIGDNPDNYVTFAGDDAGWRIVGMFDGYIKLVKVNSVGEFLWNSISSGYADWEEPATLRTELNNSKYEFYNSGLVELYNWCIGSTPTDGSNNSYLRDCSVRTAEATKIGLVSIYDVSQATWLRNMVGNDFSWTITKDNGCANQYTNRCASVFSSAQINKRWVNNERSAVNPTVYLKQDLTYTGLGTSTNPYIFHKRTNSITLDVNKGNSLPSNKQVIIINDGESYGKLPSPTRDEYTFAGWYTKNNHKISKNDIPIDDVTLYAHWTWNGTCEYTKNQVLFDNGITDIEQNLNLECPGDYKLEVWGAEGGSYNSTYHGGKGGYSVGTITFTETDTNLFINIGGAGKNSESCSSDYPGGYNGGGNSYHWINRNVYSASGGGATHIATVSGTLQQLGYTEAVTNGKLLIAAGGGGGGYVAANLSESAIGGAGGGLIGMNGTANTISPSRYGLGGTQTEGGKYAGNGRAIPGFGSFGKGGDSSPTASESGGSGGGSGFFGGGGSTVAGGGGGSSYIGGVTNGQTIAGDSEMPSPNGGTEIGHSGNGYARITYLGE